MQSEKNLPDKQSTVGKSLLLLLGVGRGLVGHRNVVLTAFETLGIAAAAALAGFLIGKLVTR